MLLPNLSRLGAQSIHVDGNEQGLPFWIYIGIQLSRPSKWAPGLPYGPKSPIIQLHFQVDKIFTETYEPSADEISQPPYDTMTIDVVGSVATNEFDLTPMHGNIIAELNFDSNKSINLKVQHAGQAENRRTVYPVKTFDLTSLKFYLAKTDSELIDFLP